MKVCSFIDNFLFPWRARLSRLQVISCDTKEESIEALREMVALRVCQGRSSYIVKYQDSWRVGLTVYMVMEFAERGDLHSRLVEHAKAMQYLDEEQILRWLVQITLALSEIHQYGLMHRDLKVYFSPHLSLSRSLFLIRFHYNCFYSLSCSLQTCS